MLEEVKSKLKITWDDEDSDIQDMIDRGKNRIDDLTGVSIDYTTNSSAKELLLNYCRYDYNNAVEFFEENFESEILRLQYKIGIEQLSEDDA